jgi:riboflavin synthase
MPDVFTGLVEEKGTLRARTPRGPGARIAVGCGLAALALGESISVDGVCLTVDTVIPGGFEADCSHETLARTTLGSIALGGGVNLERAVPLGGRMGGHIVSGHVDGEGVVASLRPTGDALHVEFAMPKDLARYVAEKGSICVNGVSLTVNSVTDGASAPGAARSTQDARFSVVLIPHTLHKTTLESLAAGTKVNLEVDVLARYVARLVEAGHAPGAKDAAVTDAAMMDTLKRAGFA